MVRHHKEDTFVDFVADIGLAGVDTGQAGDQLEARTVVRDHCIDDYKLLVGAVVGKVHLESYRKNHLKIGEFFLECYIITMCKANM